MILGIFFLSQPQDHIACVGGSVTMSCDYNGTNDLPFWIINSERYVSSDLPNYDGRVLTMNMLREDQNGTTYQCFFTIFDFSSSTFCNISSTIGTLTVLTPSTCEQHEGPTNITKNEGLFNIYIPCPQFNRDLPVWKINGYYYELSQLPEIYKPDYGGIYIRIIKRELNGTTFQCYSTYIRNNYERIAMGSSIGVLIVNLTSNNPPIPVQNSRLYLDHQNITYTGHNLTLAWKPTILDCSTYEIMLKNECELESFVERMINVSSRLSTAFLYDNALSSHYITIENKNGESVICQWMNVTFQFSEYGIFNVEAPASFSKLQAEFIHVSTSSMFYLVLPREGAQQDCFCPAIFDGVESCFELEHCSCINHTKFTNSLLKVCKIDEYHNYNISIQALRREMNNSNIHIFQGFYCNDELFPPYREYTNSFKIMIVLPEPPTIVIHEDENRVCFESGPVNGISVNYYELIVSDVTGEQVFITSIHTPNNCSYLRRVSLQDKNCAPYYVSVQAFNSKGSSETSVAVVNGSQDTTELETCSCYIAKFGVICSLDTEMKLK